MGMLKEGAHWVVSFADKLPVLERTAFYAGGLAVVYGAVETEAGNPLFAALHLVIGAATLSASVSTAEAMEELDNRGDL